MAQEKDYSLKVRLTQLAGAFDELYMGVKHFRNGIGFVVMPEG